MDSISNSIPKDEHSLKPSHKSKESENITIVIIKDEEEELENREWVTNNSTSTPKPLERLYEAGPSPFLSKTFEMVEHPETDPIVSWGFTSDSFVVWDPHKFSADLLPKYFKHSNFSSFVRQLNTYGFRKVHLDRWEFANSGFQRGKKHLLKTIKRRSRGTNNNARLLQLERETELDKLKNEQETLRVEIHDLKQQQQNSDRRLADIEERVKFTEWKHRQFVMLVAKLLRRSSSFQQAIDNYRQKKHLGIGQICKRRRLTSTENFSGSFQEPGAAQIADECQTQDMVATQSEMNSFLCLSPIDDVVDNPIIQDQKSSPISETSSQDLSSGNYIMWEKLMEDDVICEDNEDEALAANQSQFVHVLEDLIAKPPTWGSLTSVGEVACPIGMILNL